MKILPGGTHDRPEPITPLIKIFILMIVVNAFAGVTAAAWILLRAEIIAQRRLNAVSANGMAKYLLFGFLAFDLILFGTFLLLNHSSTSSE